ncbi:MAG: hypothetical protein WA609_01610 [Terriglobales bacterium]
MSLVIMLMIGGWVTTLSMVGICALNESGKLRTIRRRLALWLLANPAGPVGAPQEGLRPESENVA